MAAVVVQRLWRAAQVLRLLSSDRVVEPAFAETTVGAHGLRCYASKQEGRTLVLLHGVSARGAADKRLVRLARVLAHHGVTSYVPHLSGLADFSEDVEDLKRVEEAIVQASRGGSRQISLLGFSLGGGYGLLCAAKPKLAECLERVTVVGGHHRLDEVWSNMSSKLNDLTKRIDRATEAELYFALGCAAPRLHERQLGEEGVQMLRTLLTDFCDGADLPRIRAFVMSHLEPHWSVIAQCHSSLRTAELSPAGRLRDVRAQVNLLHAPDDELVGLTHATRNFDELGLRGGRAQSFLATRLLDHVQPRLRESWREIPGMVQRFAELMP